MKLNQIGLVESIMLALNTSWYFILLVLAELTLPSVWFCVWCVFLLFFLWYEVEKSVCHFSWLHSIQILHNAKRLTILKMAKLLGSTLFFSAWKLHFISDLRLFAPFTYRFSCPFCENIIRVNLCWDWSFFFFLQKRSFLHSRLPAAEQNSNTKITQVIA